MEDEVLQLLYPTAPEFEWDLLVMQAPPRHGKSTFLSQKVLIWWHCLNPHKNSLLTSYGLKLARKHSRVVRDGVHQIAPAYDLKGINPDIRSAEEWQIDGHSGGMKAAGIGGGITGLGADILAVDDYLKNAEQALSRRIRETQWEWMQTTALTRLEPGGKAIMLACLVGDTAVSMADGTTKPIRDIRRGDMVQTCNGRLESRKIVNHACVGHDNVFKIVLESGREVRGNARHPFMVTRDGELQWVRLRNLRRNDELITVSPTQTKAKRVSGECTLACCASGMRDATNKQTARATAQSTTHDKGGERASGLPLTTQCRTGELDSSIGTASHLNSTRQWSSSSRESVQPAENHQPQPTCESIRASGSLSITATTQEQCEGSSAIIATLQQDIQEQPPMQIDWLCTSDFTSDRIVSIEPDGFEPVYDIEVDGTENFIANGIVSHNTRWHEDDLIGQMLKFALQSKGLRVREIRMPALAEPEPGRPDVLGRQTDEALWPERIPAEQLMRLRDTLEPYWWNALYQQRLGSYGSSEWPTEYFYGIFAQEDEWPELFHLSATALDPSKGKNSRTGDYSAIVTVGFTRGYIWVDCSIERRPVPQMMKDLVEWNTRHRPTVTGIESVAFQELLATDYVQAQAEMGEYRDEPVLIDNTVRKELRIARLGTWLRLHRIKVRNTPSGRLLVEQMRDFPNGQHDDGPDAFEMAMRLLMSLSDALAEIYNQATHRVVP